MTTNQKNEVRRLAATGASTREIAEAVGLSHTAVGKFLRRERAATGNPPSVETPAEQPSAFLARLRAECEGKTPNTEAPSERTAEPPPDGLTDPDLLSFVRSSMRAAQGLAGEARAAGNFAAGQRATRDAAAFAAIAARLEKVERADENVLRISRAEIDAAYESVLEKARIVCERPLLCADCGRRLSVRLAGGDDE